MRALIVGAVGVLGVLYLSTAAMAQSRNRVTIFLKNNANHSFGLHDVLSRPQAKGWTWSPDTVKPNDTGVFSGYWDDNQGQTVAVEVQGMTPGPYGCLVSCSVTVNVPLYDATSEGMKCPQSKPTVSYKTTSNNNVCGNVTCRPTSSTTQVEVERIEDTCSYRIFSDFNDPDHR